MRVPLFTPAKTAQDLFPTEKEAAAIARVPDDHKKWGAVLHSELLRWAPYLANHDVEIVLDRVDPEAGAGLGYAQIRNRTRARPQDNASKSDNIIRIPLVIQDRKLEKFLVFEAGGEVYPLTEQRVEQAMLNPSTFDTDVKRVPRASSLVDQLYPPYQQRQGFGRIVEPGAAGLSKLSSAPEETTAATGPEEAALARAIALTGAFSMRAMSGRLANQTAPRGLKEKAEEIARKFSIPVGLATGVLLYLVASEKGAPRQLPNLLTKHLNMDVDKAMKLSDALAKGAAAIVGAGAGAGALATGLVTGAGARAVSPWVNSPHKANKRKKVEKKAGLSGFLSKEAELPDLCLGHFRSLLAHLVAQYHLFYQAHWLAAGTGFYGDHELFEKLYNSVRGEVDQLVERAVGLWGQEVIRNPGDLHQVVAHLLGEWSVMPVLEGACESEHQFQGKIKAFYECLDENGKLTLGLEDLLPAMASKHEGHSYLLERRKGGIEKSAMVHLDFSIGRAIPGSMVLDKIKNPPEFMPGTVISSNYYFFPVQGTAMYMGVKKDQAKKLDKLKDQNARRKALMRLAYKEMHTTRTGRKSSGDLILVTKTKDGFRYETPVFGMGGGPAAPPARRPVRQAMSKKAAIATKTDPGKWEAAKAEAKQKMGGKHSARAMQLATQLYKKKGGGYSGPKPDSSSNSLKRWTEQKWGWTGGKKNKGIYLPKEKVERLKGSKDGRKALARAAKKKREATESGRQYSSHGLAAGTSLRPSKEAGLKFGSKKERGTKERVRDAAPVAGGSSVAAKSVNPAAERLLGAPKLAQITYRGKTFPGYNTPVKSDREGKKKMVLAKKDDKVKLIHYGHSGYKHNYSKSAKKNYLTRSAGIRNKSGELTANDKFSANYWARKDLWPSGKADGSSASEREK